MHYNYKSIKNQKLMFVKNFKIFTEQTKMYPESLTISENTLKVLY